MEPYSSEQEQIDTIKRWWNNNGKALILGLVVGIGGLAGYRYWDSTQTARAEGASINYELMLQLMNEQRFDDVEKTGQVIAENYPDTPYARLSTLLVAKVAADRGDYEEAESLLVPLAADAGDGEIQAIANARLARLALARNDGAAAARYVDAVPNLPDGDRFSELRADVLAAQGELERARTLYVKAMVEAERLGLDSSSIQLKLDNLASATSGS